MLVDYRKVLAGAFQAVFVVSGLVLPQTEASLELGEPLRVRSSQNIDSRGWLLRRDHPGTEIDSVESPWLSPRGSSEYSAFALGHLNPRVNEEEGYKLLKIIGEGSTATVWFGKDKENHEYAVKDFKKKQFFNNEAKALELASKNNPYVTQFHQKVDTIAQSLLVSEYCPDGTLADLVEKSKFFASVTPNKINTRLRSAVSEVLKGLIQAHKEDVFHRDLKPANIFIVSTGHGEAEEVTLKIGDFGTASLSKQSRNPAGSLRIAAPGKHCLILECVNANTAATEALTKDTSESEPLDTFSLGVVMLYMINGVYPWKRANLQDPDYRRYSKGTKEFFSQGYKHMTPECIDLANKMLEKSPSGRPSLDEVLETISKETFEFVKST
ncbi:hypothetical protein MMC09_004935 [Bachmanniomyces sp. S44760]|nr:hypothetical protein [Bachmanniomyces sp. S44760]